MQNFSFWEKIFDNLYLEEGWDISLGSFPEFSNHQRLPNSFKFLNPLFGSPNLDHV